MKMHLLVTNSGARGCHWHVFAPGETLCMCRTYSEGQIAVKATKKKYSEDELIETLQEEDPPGLGSWSGRCRRKALESLTGEKQFSCSECGKPISSISGLKVHVSRTHGKPMEAAEEMAVAKGGA